MKINLTGLFSSKKGKQDKNELENKVKTVLKKFEHDDLIQFCLDVIGKEPEWHYMGDGLSEAGILPRYEPPELNEIEDFIWEHVRKNETTYKQFQDYSVKHSLVPRNYFPEREGLISNNEIFGFSESVKSITLKKQDRKCERCGRYSPPYFFDHKDGNHSNNSPNNCQALCITCYKRKNLEHY